MNDRPGAEKFHDDHKQMCEICRGLDEALGEAHARLSDRVTEVERLRAALERHHENDFIVRDGVCGVCEEKA
jgi:hypothetical protein